MGAHVPEAIDLPIEGMTCAACASRIERRLNALDGVDATVNYATAEATVTFDPDVCDPERLAATVASAGYRAVLPAANTTRGRDDDLRLRLILAAVLSLPVVLMSMIPPLQFDGWQWLCLALTTPVVSWCAWPIHRATLVNARHRATTMDTLITMGTSAAYAWSVVAMVALGAGDLSMRMRGGLHFGAGHGSDVFFDAAAAVITLILLGRFLEHRATRKAGSAIRALAELGATDAVAVRDGREITIPIAELVVGDRFVVRPGAKIATDGVVREGISAIDRSFLTGESMPADVGPGDAVEGGAINRAGRLVVEATRVGADTALARINRLVREAQRGKAPIQRLADRVSAVFVPIVIGLAAATLAGWLLAGRSATFAFGAAVAVLVVACPCALGLATPTALMAGTGRGAQLGILIRGPQVLERTDRITAVVLDKTGTVTQGRMELTGVAPLNGGGRRDALRLAGAVEAASEHPIGRAVTDAARREFGELPQVEDFVSVPGVGVRGVVEGTTVEVTRGRDGVVVAADGTPLATLALRDTVKPTSRAAIAQMHAMGLSTTLLTGDGERTARAVAAEVGVGNVRFEVLPDAKVAEIARLRAAGETVAMVGDGVNDAPALAAADLGIAMGSGTDAAMAASDITLVTPDLIAAVDAIRLGRRTLATIKGNLFWAFAYNVAALPLAATGRLNPVIAAAAMAFSSIFVVLNSLRLRGFATIRQAAPAAA